MFPRSTVLPVHSRLLRDDIHIWEFSTAQKYDSVYTHDGVLAWESD